MVSFSCDACQNVFTKPKVERHMQSCRTRSVSCIDCSAVFDVRSVRAHTSCITEAEKYAPKVNNGTECTQTFCGICKLALHGAVHALQHYESKKHRAAERKSKAAGRSAKAKKVGAEPSEGGEVVVADGAAVLGEGANLRDVTVEGKKGKRGGLKKAMKRILKKTPKQRLKRGRLVRAIAELLGEDAPGNLAELVDKKACTSNRFKVKNGRVSLVDAESS